MHLVGFIIKKNYHDTRSSERQISLKCPLLCNNCHTFCRTKQNKTKQNPKLISFQSQYSNDTTRGSYISKVERNKLHYLPEFTQLHRTDGVLVFGLCPQFWRKCCRMYGSRASCRQLVASCFGECIVVGNSFRSETAI